MPDEAIQNTHRWIGIGKQNAQYHKEETLDLLDSNPEPQIFITGFSVVDLFGLYSYEVNLPHDLSENERRLLIVYGDNGCGKTTIINIIHHLLSPDSAKGHRSYLANTRFKRFTLVFSNDKSIEVEKRNDSGVGDYVLRLVDQNSSSTEVVVNSKLDDDEYVVRASDIDEDQIEKLYGILYPQPLSVMTLTDNREFRSDRFETENEPDALWMQMHTYVSDLSTSARRRLRRRTNGSVGDQVETSIHRAEEWIRRQTLAARSRNDESVAGIYTQLIRTFDKVLAIPSKPSGTNTDELLARVDDLSEEIARLSRLGFTTDLPREELFAAIEDVAPEHIPNVAGLLQPYFDSIETRIIGLTPIATRLTTFSSIVNGFFRSKRFKLNAVSGIEIISKNNDPIPANMLSSGEKHLLLMLCNILVGTTERSLFLIDEPELSLNVKWQRELIGSLLDLSEGSSVQFIMATHSIELLSQHRNCTMRLEDK